MTATNHLNLAADGWLGGTTERTGIMVHPQHMGCTPEYRWKGRERCILWRHCKRGDVDVNQEWDGQHWIVTVKCRTCGQIIKG